ncbi:uncharacterized protein LOC107139897 [Marmota marmota marmota]|uniref:uncharacterized protein LOC107139897 n=1 Tax=Marmota marmota marmota TaxID=9994 RepID=UPI0020931F80|nr:uncharacterized protein LOC107139897 [Marmota marmota marmota]
MAGHSKLAVSAREAVGHESLASGLATCGDWLHSASVFTQDSAPPPSGLQLSGLLLSKGKGAEALLGQAQALPAQPSPLWAVGNRQRPSSWTVAQEDVAGGSSRAAEARAAWEVRAGAVVCTAGPGPPPPTQAAWPPGPSPGAVFPITLLPGHEPRGRKALRDQLPLHSGQKKPRPRERTGLRPAGGKIKQPGHRPWKNTKCGPEGCSPEFQEPGTVGSWALAWRSQGLSELLRASVSR